MSAAETIVDMACALSLRSTIYLLTAVPLSAVIAAVVLLRFNQARKLGRKENEAFHSAILRAERQELKG